MSRTEQLIVVFVAANMAGFAVFFAAQAFADVELRPRRIANRRPVGQRLEAATPQILVGVVVAVVVLVTTRWPVAAGAAVALTVGWSALFPKDSAAQRSKLEGVAKWMEDLRDLQRGSSLDLAETLDHSARRAPTAIKPELDRFSSRVRHHVPLPEALLELADELDHPVVDTAVAAMVFSAGDASGASLHATFDMLADSARDELTARDSIDRIRLRFHRAMRQMLIVLAGLIGYLVLFAPDIVEPYRTVEGQIWLLIPVGVWGGSLWWLRSLGRYERLGRFISADALREEASAR